MEAAADPSAPDARLSKAAIADHLREQIVSGALPMGERLYDKEIARGLKVSRTPVREALLALASEGLIVIRPQSGTFVFALTDSELRDICELRGVYEGGALQIAAAQDRDGLVAALTGIVARAGFALEADDLTACEALDTAFHQTLVEQSGNGALVDAYARMSGKVGALRASLPGSRDRFAAAHAQHRQIVDCIAAGEVTKAVDEVYDHVHNVNRILDRVRAGEASD